MRPNSWAIERRGAFAVVVAGSLALGDAAAEDMSGGRQVVSVVQGSANESQADSLSMLGNFSWYGSEIDNSPIRPQARSGQAIFV